MGTSPSREQVLEAMKGKGHKEIPAPPVTGRLLDVLRANRGEWHSVETFRTEFIKQGWPTTSIGATLAKLKNKCSEIETGKSGRATFYRIA